MPDNHQDDELKAIQTLISALEPLDKNARARVLQYVFQRLGLSPASIGGNSAFPAQADHNVILGHSPPPSTFPRADIRSLAEEKRPRSAIEMAVLGAYYLSEIAPLSERKVEIDRSDILKLFKQANYIFLPSPKMTLVHAKNAGYFDPGTTTGTYRLNPVGYNLAAHKLPSASPKSGPPAKKKRSFPKRKPQAQQGQSEAHRRTAHNLSAAGRKPVNPTGPDPWLSLWASIERFQTSLRKSQAQQVNSTGLPRHSPRNSPVILPFCTTSSGGGGPPKHKARGLGQPDAALAAAI